MLSISGVGNAGGAADYYTKDNYYTRDEEAFDNAKWTGEAADALGVSGKVDREQLNELLEGRFADVQTGEAVELGRSDGEGGKEHRAGWDLTFSAPKSVSVLALEGGDARILEAHQNAVEKAFATMEAKAATRIKGETVQTGNLAAVMVTHDTSRAQDPQLHTHCVIANATKCEDGQWRSLESRTLYQAKMEGGAAYRAELAHGLERAGYQLDIARDGTFEVRGVPEAVIADKSTRRQDIEAELAERGLSSAKASQIATLDTREKKEMIEDREALRAGWRERSDALGYDARDTIAEAQSRAQTPEHQQATATRWQPAQAGREAVQHAIEHHFERAAVVADRDIMRRAMENGVGRTTHEHIERAFNAAKAAGQLVETDRPGQLTTRETLDREDRIIDNMRDGKGTVSPVVSAREVERVAGQAFDGKGLNREQTEAVKAVLCSRDQQTGIQGAAGAGKTSALGTAFHIADRQGVTMRGMAPSNEAARVLQDDINKTAQSFGSRAGVQTTSVSQFLANLKSGQDLPAKGEIWVVDESSMVSAKHADQIQQAANRFDARVSWVGDRDQFGSVEQGRSFGQMQDAGMRTAQIKSEIMRQKDAPNLLQAATALAQAKGHESTEKAVAAWEKDKAIRQVVNDEKRLDSMSREYLKGSDQVRAGTLVITPRNVERTALNDRIREGLKTEGKLSGPAVKADVYVKQDATRAQMKDARTYQAGDVVKFNRSYKALDVKSGERAQVVGVDKDKNTVTLKTEAGKDIKLDVAGNNGRGFNTSLSRLEGREIQKGDFVRFTDKDGKIDVNNGARGTVSHVDHAARVASVNMTDGSTRRVDLDKNKAWDHGYAVTAHASQGQSPGRAIVNCNTKDSRFGNYSNFYVSGTRAKEDLKIYTDSPDRLAAWGAKDGQNVAARDAKPREVQGLTVRTTQQPAKNMALSPAKARDAASFRRGDTVRFEVAGKPVSGRVSQVSRVGGKLRIVTERGPKSIDLKMAKFMDGQRGGKQTGIYRTGKDGTLYRQKASITGGYTKVKGVEKLVVTAAHEAKQTVKAFYAMGRIAAHEAGQGAKQTARTVGRVAGRKAGELSRTVSRAVQQRRETQPASGRASMSPASGHARTVERQGGAQSRATPTQAAPDKTMKAPAQTIKDQIDQAAKKQGERENVRDAKTSLQNQTREHGQQAEKSRGSVGGKAGDLSRGRSEKTKDKGKGSGKAEGLNVGGESRGGGKDRGR